MGAFKLRFTNHDHPELSLGTGVHAIGRIDRADGTPPQDRAIGLVEQAPLLRLCIDRRGVWMTVDEGVRGVHVNGRPVQRIAMLRPGDAVFVDGAEIALLAERGADAMPQALANVPVVAGSDPRVVLRGVGGDCHGRSFTLEQPKLVGRAGDADIRIDDPAVNERHARIELHGETIVLRDLGSENGCLVNGETVRDALLQPGDQVVFASQHRFVVEAPGHSQPLHEAFARSETDVEDGGESGPHGTWRHSARRLPWLLLAALLLAAGLSALLLLGAL